MVLKTKRNTNGLTSQTAKTFLKPAGLQIQLTHRYHTSQSGIMRITCSEFAGCLPVRREQKAGSLISI